jgi:O-antigen/teichoic acid export membrane protein
MSRTLNKRQLTSDAFWALFGQVVSASALLVGTRILTELVSPGIYGQVALLNGFVALGVALFSYPFICAGMRLLPECQGQGDRAALYAVVTKLIFRSTVLAISLIALGGGIYRYFSHVDFGLLMLLSILLVVTVWREIGIQLLIGERQQRNASLWQTSDSFLRPLLGISLVWWCGQTAEWVLLGYILASFFSNTVWAFIHRVKAKNSLNRMARNFKDEIWAYALPLIPMEMIFWVNGLGDRYIIGYFMSAAEVGLYAATYLIVNEAFNRSAVVLLRTFQPAYFQACSQNNPKEGFRVLWLWIVYVSALGIIGVSLLYLTKDWVVSLLLAKTYHTAVELIPAIAIGCSLHALGTVAAQPLLAKKQTQLILLGRLCGVITAVISIPLMVKNYGLLGAAIANPIYFGIEALVLTILAKPWRANDIQNPDLKESTCKIPA